VVYLFLGYSEGMPFAGVSGLCMAVGSLIWLVLAWTARIDDTVRSIESKVTEKRHEIQNLELRIAKQRKIVD